MSHKILLSKYTAPSPLIVFVAVIKFRRKITPPKSMFKSITQVTWGRFFFHLKQSRSVSAWI